MVSVKLHILYKPGHSLFLVDTCGSWHITLLFRSGHGLFLCPHVWFLSYYTFYSDQATVCFLSSRVVPDILHSYSDQATVCFLSSREVPVILHILFKSSYGVFLIFMCGSWHSTLLFGSGYGLFFVVTWGSCHITHFIQIRPRFVSCRHVWFLPNYTCYPDHCLFSCCHVSLAVTLTFFECDEQVVYLTSSLIIKVL